MNVREDWTGYPIKVGDTVAVKHLDGNRGAMLWMNTGTVTGFGRTRVAVKFPSRGKSQMVGNECLRVLSR